MIDFMKIAEDSYVVYKNGKRITPIPLNKDELVESLSGLNMTDSETIFIERFYGEAIKHGATS